MVADLIQIELPDEDALSVCAVLVAYIPMLMDTGGNAGSQASVTVIRGLSLNEIEYRDVPKVVFKEIRVALICGITLSAANFVKLLLLDKVGVLVPMTLEKLKVDPAIATGPFIAITNDIIGMMLYMGITVLLS